MCQAQYLYIYLAVFFWVGVGKIWHSYVTVAEDNINLILNQGNFC